MNALLALLYTTKCHRTVHKFVIWNVSKAIWLKHEKAAETVKLQNVNNLIQNYFLFQVYVQVTTAVSDKTHTDVAFKNACFFTWQPAIHHA